MAKRTFRCAGPFRGLVSEPPGARLDPTQATDVLNVYTSDGSIRSRPGFDRINGSAPIRDLAAFDSFLRDNSLTLSTVGGSTISGATQANPVVITSTSHGRANGDVVRIGGVVGMVEINSRFFTVANADTNTFELEGEDGTGHTAYFSGGRTYHTEPVTSGVVWGELTQASDTLSLNVYNGTARGSRQTGAALTCANILLNAAGSASPITGANYTVEFALRKWEGFGRTGASAYGSFQDSHDSTRNTFYFGVQLRSKCITHMDVADVDDDGYQVEFGVRVGAPTYDDAGWNDLAFKIQKRTNGSTADLLSHAGTNEAPGPDEWVRIKVEIYGTSTTTIKVYIDGTLSETHNDSSSPFTAAGFVKIHVRATTTTEDQETLRRQIQIAGFRVYANDGAGNNNESALRVNGLAAYAQQEGNPVLVAKAGNTLVGRAMDESSFNLLDVSAPIVNRRDGQTPRSEGVTIDCALLNYSVGHDVFTITDDKTDSSGGGLPGYSFTDGDRVELLECEDANVTLAIYEIDHFDAQSDTLYVKTAPASANLSDKKVAYRILARKAPGTFPALLSSTSELYADFAVANRMLYLADGSDRLVRTEGAVAHLVGIKAPTIAPTIAESSEGATLNGDTYTYKFTYYNPSLGLESSPSPASSGVALNNGVRLTIGEGETGNAFDVTATHVRLYRQNTTDGEEDWFFTKRLPIPIDNYQVALYVFDDTDDGSQLTTLTVPDATENDRPPKATICEYHRDRMWYAEADSTKLYYSSLGRPDHVSPTDFLRIGRDDGEAITALWPGRALYLDSVTAVLLVLKEHSLWMVVGNSTTDFAVHKLAGVGSLNAKASAADEQGNLYFAGAEGIHRWSVSGGLQDRHYGIGPTYFGYELSRLDRMAMAVDQKDGLVLLSVTISGNSEQDRLLVLHYRKPPTETPGGLIYDWTVWNPECVCFAVETEAVGAATGPGQRKLRFGQSGGFVATLRGENGTALADVSTAIGWSWTGPKLDLGTKRSKRWHDISAEFVKQSVATTLQVGYVAGDETTAYVATADDSAVTRKLRSVRRRAQYLRPYVGATATTAECQVTGYELSVEPLGQR